MITLGPSLTGLRDTQVMGSTLVNQKIYLIKLSNYYHHPSDLIYS
jgi:hypothetical protein